MFINWILFRKKDLCDIFIIFFCITFKPNWVCLFQKNQIFLNLDLACMKTVQKERPEGLVRKTFKIRTRGIRSTGWKIKYIQSQRRCVWISYRLLLAWMSFTEVCEASEIQETTCPPELCQVPESYAVYSTDALWACWFKIGKVSVSITLYRNVLK